MPTNSWRRRGMSVCATAFSLALAAGCGGPPSPIQQTIDAMESCVELMEPIADANSARAAIPQIEPTFKALADATVAVNDQMKDPEQAMRLMLQARKVLPDLDRVTGDFEVELERLNTLKGLPEEFWNEFRVEWYHVNRAMAAASAEGDPDFDPALLSAMDQVVAMLDQHGPQRTVEFKLTSAEVGNKDAAIARIVELAGPNAQVVSFQEPEVYDEWLVAVAPVSDFDKLIAAVDFGNVSDQDPAKREATIELEAVENESLETTATEPAVAVEGDAIASAPPAETTVAYDPREGTPPPNAAIPIETAEAAPGDESTMSQVKARLGEFLTTLAANAANGGMLPAAGAPGEPMPFHPNYHAQLAELLFDAQSPFHEKAVLGLLEVGPKDVPDKKLRGRIAQGYRHVAFETQAHMAEGVRGLVLWGGKFSAPLLIQLLERNAAGGMGGDEAVYAGLGEIATAEGAEAVVARVVAGGTSSEAAWACLRQMGPVAEAALVAELPFESPEANQAAIGVLGEIGTKKSNAILRRATKSENEAVATAALDALKAIGERARAAAAGESGAAAAPPVAPQPAPQQTPATTR